MTIVDTTVWIDYLRGAANPHTDWLDLARFEVFDSGGEALAVAAARNYRSLRSSGHTVRKTIDCLIATFCLTERHSLLHRDHDFDAFEKYLGLRVVHP